MSQPCDITRASTVAVYCIARQTASARPRIRARTARSTPITFKSFRTCDLRACDPAFAWVLPLILFDYGSHSIQYPGWQLCEIRRFYRVSFVTVWCPYGMRGRVGGVPAVGFTSEARRAASCRVWKGLREGPANPCRRLKRCSSTGASTSTPSCKTSSTPPARGGRRHYNVERMQSLRVRTIFERTTPTPAARRSTVCPQTR